MNVCFPPFPDCLNRESADVADAATGKCGLWLAMRGVTLDGGGITAAEGLWLWMDSLDLLSSLLSWTAESAGECRRGISFLTPFIEAERSAEALLVLSCDGILGGLEPTTWLVKEFIGVERGIPFVFIIPWPFTPALTRSCCRLRASLSTDTPEEPPAFWPPKRRVIFGLFSGDRAGIRSLTFGCGGSATTRFASASRRLK